MGKIAVLCLLASANMHIIPDNLFSSKTFFGGNLYVGMSFPAGACVSWCTDVEFGRSSWK